MYKWIKLPRTQNIRLGWLQDTLNETLFGASSTFRISPGTGTTKFAAIYLIDTEVGATNYFRLRFMIEKVIVNDIPTRVASFVFSLKTQTIRGSRVDAVTVDYS